MQRISDLNGFRVGIWLPALFRDYRAGGRVIGINDIISYEGLSIGEIKQDFQETIDWYLEDCAARGKQPDKPFSGAVMVNIEPQLQARLERQAMEAGLSLNELVLAKLAAM